MAWVCGLPKYHGFEAETIEPELTQIAGTGFASDGRRLKQFVCRRCPTSFFTRAEGYSHWVARHAAPARPTERTDHGDWVQADRALGWMCKSVAVAEVRRQGPRYLCDGCGEYFTSLSGARVHWQAAHVRPAPSGLRPIDHGTERGYFQHRRRKEPACGPCRAAHTEAGRHRSQQWIRGSMPVGRNR